MHTKEIKLSECQVLIFHYIIQIIIIFTQLSIFVYHTLDILDKQGWIGLNGPVPFDSVLIYNPHKRHEAWRFISYMFVHSG